MFSTKNKFFLAVLALGKNRFFLTALGFASLLLVWSLARHPTIDYLEEHHDFLLVFATFLLVVATFLLAMVVIFQIRDARLSSERQLRAYVFVEETN